MFRHLVSRLARQLRPQNVCSFCARSHTTEQSTKWKLATAVCVERYPVITQEMNEIEKKYDDLMTKIDIENSLLSAHEVQLRQDQIKAKQRVDDDEEITLTGLETQTALDKEDEWDAELKAYAIPSRIAEADENFKSTKRKLDRKLVLIVQQIIGGKPLWILPQTYYNNEDSLKEAAENALQEHCGTDLKSSIFSNAPSGVYQYKLPKQVSESDGASGVKVFFYRAEFNGGAVKINEKKKDITDYKWVTLEELSDYLVPAYEKAVKQFVLEF